MYVSHLECPKCNATYESEQRVQLCRCGSPLLVRYDLKKVKRTFRKKALVSRRENLWRYRELLPVNKEENIVSLGEGMTPLIHLKHSGPKLGVNHLYLKDEGLIPTGTFKARGAAVGVSRAKELRLSLAMPTNGNAGGSWAAYCAKAGIKAIISNLTLVGAPLRLRIARRTPEEGYHFTEDMTDKAINWVRQQEHSCPTKPFFVCTPHNARATRVPKEWSDKSKGQFDQGWDALGPRRSRARRPWASSHRGRADEAPAATPPGRICRSGETHPGPADGNLAGFLEHTDSHVGRLISTLEDLEILDDTLIYYPSPINGQQHRGRAQDHLQRDDHAQQRHAGMVALIRPDSCASTSTIRHAESLQPLCGRLGARHGHPLPVDQAGFLAPGAAPATAGHHAHWPAGIKTEARSKSVPSRDRRPRRRCSKPRACPATAWSTACSRSH